MKSTELNKEQQELVFEPEMVSVEQNNELVDNKINQQNKKNSNRGLRTSKFNFTDNTLPINLIDNTIRTGLQNLNFINSYNMSYNNNTNMGSENNSKDNLTRENSNINMEIQTNIASTVNLQENALNQQMTENMNMPPNIIEENSQFVNQSSIQNNIQQLQNTNSLNIMANNNNIKNFQQTVMPGQSMQPHIIGMSVPQLDQNQIYNPNQGINMAPNTNNNLNQNLNNMNAYKNLNQANIIQQNHDSTNNEKLFENNMNKMSGMQQNINKNQGKILNFII